jgi:8-oxo-dGTP diphosphatase
LRLPPVCGITMASDLGERDFLARVRVAFARGLKLVQIREKDWGESRRHALCDAVLLLAKSAGAQVLLNGEATQARAWGCDGVHWTSARLATAIARPKAMLCAASCHTPQDVVKAGELGLDFVVLGPIRPTPSHPAAVPIGWDGFGESAAGSAIPIYALGGLTLGDLDAAVLRGAHGVALRRAAWG